MNTYQFIENHSKYIDLELPFIACTFEIEKIKLKQMPYNAFLTESESKAVLAEEQSFFCRKNYRFLRDYLQEDNNFLIEKNFSQKLPVPLHISDKYSVSEQENAITCKIKDGFYHSKQKLSKKKLTSRLVKNGLTLAGNSSKILIT